jgi:hypothetical protein
MLINRKEKDMSDVTVRSWKKSIPVKGRTKYDGRICFGVQYFTDPQDAEAFAAAVEEEGACYNGGWFHGMPCGRDKSFDHTDAEGVKWLAVTF